VLNRGKGTKVAPRNVLESQVEVVQRLEGKVKGNDVGAFPAFDQSFEFGQRILHLIFVQKLIFGKLLQSISLSLPSSQIDDRKTTRPYLILDFKFPKLGKL
jgi:hypothetical protein